MIMSNWTQRVEFCYRVFVRQHEDVNLWVEDFLEYFRSLNSRRLVVTFNSVEDDYWPIPPEKEEELNKKGLLVSVLDEKTCLIVRSITFAVWIKEPSISYSAVVSKVNKDIGLHNFAIVRVVNERLSDFQAL